MSDAQGEARDRCRPSSYARRKRLQTDVFLQMREGGLLETVILYSISLSIYFLFPIWLVGWLQACSLLDRMGLRSVKYFQLGLRTKLFFF
jgi:hypothetical protein